MSGHWSVVTTPSNNVRAAALGSGWTSMQTCIHPGASLYPVKSAPVGDESRCRDSFRSGLELPVWWSYASGPLDGPLALRSEWHSWSSSVTVPSGGTTAPVSSTPRAPSAAISTSRQRGARSVPAYRLLPCRSLSGHEIGCHNATCATR